MASKSKTITYSERYAESIKHAIEHGAGNLNKIKEILQTCSSKGLTVNSLRLPKSGDTVLHIAARTGGASEILR
jgi:hypothetical protein